MNKVEVKMDEKTVQYYITNLENLCKKLQQENNQLKANRDEAIKYIENHKVTIMGAYGIPIGKAYNLKEILERGK